MERFQDALFRVATRGVFISDARSRKAERKKKRKEKEKENIEILDRPMRRLDISNNHYDRINASKRNYDLIRPAFSRTYQKRQKKRPGHDISS